MKLVLDCANGAASQLGPSLFRSLGAEVIAIHDQPNGRNIKRCLRLALSGKFAEQVIETRAALGVAFDGDADRAMFVSASGRHVGRRWRATCCGAIPEIRRAVERRRVIGTTMANLGLERALEAEGLSLARCPSAIATCSKRCCAAARIWAANNPGILYFLDDAPPATACSRPSKSPAW